MAEFVLRPLSVGEILDRGFTLLRRRFGTLVIITLICTAIPLLMAMRWFGRFSKMVSTDLTGFNTMIEGMGSLFLLGLIMFIAVAIANTAIVFVISETYLGHRLGIGEALGRTLRFIFPVILLALLQQIILVAVAVVMGIPLGVLAPSAAGSGSPLFLFVFMLLYFGVQVYMLVSFFVALPALVLEPGVNAVSALGRAWSLATGNRWRMVGVLVVFVVIAGVVMLGVMLVGSLGIGLAAGPGTTQAISLGFIITVAIMAILYIIAFTMIYCLQTVVYYDLRVRKEGFDLELLEASMGSA
ncbi:MAG: hypothetical protein ABI836_04070 [Gemmatimonadota bacterium]